MMLTCATKPCAHDAQCLLNTSPRPTGIYDANARTLEEDDEDNVRDAQ